MNFKRYHESKNLLNEAEPPQQIYVTATVTRYGYEVSLPSGTYTVSGGDSTTFTKTKVGTTYGTAVDLSTSRTLVLEENGYILIYAQTADKFDSVNVMLNTGSTALPYEPYSSEVWHDTPHYIHNTSTDTITTLPADIYADGNNATVGISGNTVQSGTPTPDNPIMPQSCGERTGNLLNLSSYSGTSAHISDIVINGNSITFNASLQFLAIVYEFNLGISDVYTLALGGESFHTRLEIRYTKDGVIVGSVIVIQPNRNATISGSEEYNGFRVYISNADNTGTCTASNIMLNTGSTALPYEPYGYKIPISSANTTTPVYLGEVETTRKVKKLVLTGEEAWQLWDGNYFSPIIDRKGAIGTILCTHFINSSLQGISYNNQSTSGLKIASVAVPFVSDLSGLKEWLAAQYAAGTPVCVWYVLANKTTGIVNEPLCKIGNYADEVSGITIPTTAGANTISVDTTLQPSEVSVNYKGWHPVTNVHEFIGNYTVGTMQTLPISELETHTISELQGGEWS